VLTGRRIEQRDKAALRLCQILVHRKPWRTLLQGNEVPRDATGLDVRVAERWVGTWIHDHDRALRQTCAEVLKGA